MTTITIEKSWNLQKTHFVNLLELYEYLGDNLFLDLQFTSYEDINEKHKKAYNKSLKIDKSNLVNV